jgi:energy-coupling factor transport system permease protein
MNGWFSPAVGDSFLGRRNPALKLLSVMIPVFALTMTFDPWTPLAFFVLGLGACRLLGRVPLRRLARPLLFFFVVGAVGFLGSNALFYAPAEGQTLHILWQAGPLHISAEGLRAGVSLTLRMMALITFSLLFVMTTNPTDFILSLIQQARVPYRLGYGVLVAYRFVPLWRSELDTIRAAHRIRGAGERATLRGRWEQVQRYAIPLLAGAIRKAERVAIAMDSKAFGAAEQRTYYRRLHVAPADWALLAGAVALSALIFLVMRWAGLPGEFTFAPPA